MVSIAVSFDEETVEKIKLFSWVNWSELGREEMLKKEIFDEYVKTGKLSETSQEFCDSNDWHPVDELPLKEEIVEELKKARSKPVGKVMTLEEFNKWCGEL